MVGEHNVMLTGFAAVFDSQTGTLQYANAGQNFPYVITRGGGGVLERASIIAASGNPLGDRNIAVEIRKGSLQMRPGDLFVCFTDGVVERANKAGKLFGDRRLRSALTLEPVHRLFVNLLPMSFYDAAFIEVEVGNLLTAAGLTPANIVFEITERLAIENFASFKRALATYTRMGFGVAIDDVGTRHSNLETVMSLRPHFIKISDVLIRGIARSTVKREMLRSLRHIAETIDAVMIAEGIERL
jgi:predicted signal transduction protein with EAL and GGDEF domain